MQWLHDRCVKKRQSFTLTEMTKWQNDLITGCYRNQYCQLYNALHIQALTHPPTLSLYCRGPPVLVGLLMEKYVTATICYSCVFSNSPERRLCKRGALFKDSSCCIQTSCAGTKCSVHRFLCICRHEDPDYHQSFTGSNAGETWTTKAGRIVAQIWRLWRVATCANCLGSVTYTTFA